MLITFKSKAAADVLMYKEHAQRILDLLHKDPTRGVITAAESGAAIAALEADIATSRAHPSAEEIQRDVALQHGDLEEMQESMKLVSFATRAYPFLEMLKAANKGGHDVAWGI